MIAVHPTAIVDPRAELADDVEIGPYSCVGPAVRLAAGVRLEAHVVVTGRTTIGEGTRVYPFACLGQRPQHLKYRGEDTALVIGRHNQIREHVTMHPGTAAGTGVTRVGDHGLFMSAIHVAHDCEVGDHVIMASNATVGGHVRIQDHVFLGGVCGIHQFVRIGRYAMIEGRLDGRRFLVGDRPTETDIRAFVTLVRFDAAYHGLFKCNRRRIADYPNLSAHLERMLAVPGIARTVNIDHIKRGYYSMKALNPNGIVPVGPDLPFAPLLHRGA